MLRTAARVYFPRPNAALPGAGEQPNVLPPLRFAMLEEYEVVRVAKLLGGERHVDGTEGAVRQPEIGDLGTVLERLGPTEDGFECYIVECVGEGGVTVWLADFSGAELEHL